MASLTLFAPVSQPGFALKSVFDPQYPLNPVFTVLQIVADFNLKINLFLSFTAILFNSYFKENGLSRILIVFFWKKGAEDSRIRGFKGSNICFLAFCINLKPSSKGLSPSSLSCF